MRQTNASVRNRVALLRAQPMLERRLRSVPVHPRAVTDPEGRLCWDRGRDRVPLGLSDEAVERELKAIAPDRPVVLLGVGEGRLLEALLEATEGPVIAWERDPTVLQWVLERRDLSDALAQGRLRLALASDHVDLPLPEGHQRLVHPVAAQLYPADADLDGRDRPLAVVVDGELFVRDTVEALRELGHRVFVWDADRWPDAEHDRVLAHRPELVAAINVRPGLSERVEAAGCRLVMWEIDPSTDVLPPRAGPAGATTLFTYRRAHVPEYRAAGFADTRWLPLAANTTRRFPKRAVDAEPEHAVCFVGSSMVRAAHELRDRFDARLTTFLGATRSESEALRERLLDLQRRDLDRFGLAAWMDHALPGFRAQQMAGEPGEDPAMLLGEVAASERRLGYLARLVEPAQAHGAEVRVWGDPGWRRVTRLGVAYHGWAGHYRALDRIYSNGAVHVDIGRLYQTDIVTMRVFDVLACGGFLLAERSDDLEELFVIDEEVVCWSTFAELEQKVVYYLAHPEERRRIARAGLERVRRDHTIVGRWRHMLARAGARPPDYSGALASTRSMSV